MLQFQNLQTKATTSVIKQHLGFKMFFIILNNKRTSLTNLAYTPEDHPKSSNLFAFSLQKFEVLSPSALSWHK